jgi:hypothetical protein
MNFSRFSAFSAITGSAERKNSLQMRRFQTISEFSYSLGRKRHRNDFCAKEHFRRQSRLIRIVADSGANKDVCVGR